MVSKNGMFHNDSYNDFTRVTMISKNILEQSKLEWSRNDMNKDLRGSASVLYAIYFIALMLCSVFFTANNTHTLLLYNS